MRLDPVIVDVAAREASPTKLDRVARQLIGQPRESL
jgi:hypothetical protein